MLRIIKKKIIGLSVLQQITLGFAVIILCGALLLTLPVSSRQGQWTHFVSALFTAATSTCVTGLTVVDTYTYWSVFGQLVILVLIQIGGVGFMTLAVSALTLTKKKIGLRQRLAMREVSGANRVAGIVKRTRFIIVGTFIVEAAGAFILAARFIPKLGFLKGVYFSVFHSVSAFCNAGIDLMSDFKEGSSLITVNGDIVFNVTVILLIVLGGLGFLVWEDVLENRFRLKKCRLHTKIVLMVTGILIFGGAALIFLFEFGSQAFFGFNAGKSALAALFQSVTARTAGFYSVDIGSLREPTLLLLCFLMLVGGSPASTAGGIKTTSFAVLFMSFFLVFRNKESIEVFKRRISREELNSACCLLMLFVFLILSSTLAISFIENLPILSCLFETTSAVATVGLSVGITPRLSVVSRMILILLMYVGRVGALTMLLSFSKHKIIASKYTEEKISIG